MAASGRIGLSTYGKEKPASIGINAGYLVMVATKSRDGMARAFGLSAALKASQPALISQT